MGYSLGIDFGTSTTKVAIKQDDKPPVALLISATGDKQFMPSVVAYRRTLKNTAEVYAIGEDAERAPNTEDFRVIRDIKRFLEVKENTPKDFPYSDYPWWNKDNNCVELWASSFEVEDVIRVIITEALNRAIREARKLGLIPQTRRSKWQVLLSKLKKMLGRREKNNDILTIEGWPIRLGCSVTAGLETRRTLNYILRKLGFTGFKFEHIREEPVLALLPYLNREMHPDDIVLVYDFGGGTFDTAVIQIGPMGQNGIPSITVLSAYGEPFCGGTDIDKEFARYIIERIAVEYLGNSNALDQKITDGIREQVERQAREAKELLSNQTQVRVVMPPGFLDIPSIELLLTREELEQVIIQSKLVDKTFDCILRAWKKARMVYRKPNEVAGEFHLEVDSKTGIISKTVFQLRFDDLSSIVSHILLIGGTTRIPLVQKRLTSLFNQAKFIAETDPYEPIIACALGGASHRENISVVIDRLPFSIVVKQGDNETAMYRAYTPTISYNTLTDNPKIKNFISNNVFSVSPNSDDLTIECRTPDGEVISQDTNLKAPPGRYAIEINSYGTIRFGGQEVNNPRQHPLQKDMLARIEKEKDRLEQEELERTRRHMFRLPSEDHNLEVG